MTGGLIFSMTTHASDAPPMLPRCHAARLFIRLFIRLFRCRFLSLDWDRAHAELVLGDELGYVHFGTAATERCMKCEQLQRGHATGAEPAAGGGAPVRDLCLVGSELVASQGAGVDTWRVLRDVKYVETRGHTGAVIALASVEPEYERAVRRAPAGSGGRGGRNGGRGGGGGEGGGADASVIYSASLDGT